ncbi:mCG145132, partial [Mus musculus]
KLSSHRHRHGLAILHAQEKGAKSHAMNELWYSVLSKMSAVCNCSYSSSSQESTSNSTQVNFTVLNNATQIRGQMCRDGNV